MGTNQHLQIISYMEEHGNITSFIATIKLGVCNLPQRIKELKALGVAIDKRKVIHRNRNGNSVRYNEYYLRTDADTSAIEKLKQEPKHTSAKQELINTIVKTKFSPKQINILIEFINQIKNKRGSN